LSIVFPLLLLFLSPLGSASRLAEYFSIYQTCSLAIVIKYFVPKSQISTAIFLILSLSFLFFLITLINGSQGILPYSFSS